MMSLQGLRLRTEYMMEQIRIDAIEDTLRKWKEALKKYYEVGYDNGETTRLYKELEKLGADTEKLIEIDLSIRDEVCGI
ncbi:MAG: hypothetical protein NC398_11715 [Acetatifactor muris]|nr:hypothetical protein [Acetatifactor muris]